jgi:hypothetical protein
LLFLPLLETIGLTPDSSVLPSWRTTIICPGKYLVVLSLMAFNGDCKGTTRRRAKVVAIVEFRELVGADTILAGELANPPPAIPVVM